jgi:RNA polymerase sigma-70 factor (ECF subfamily)
MGINNQHLVNRLQSKDKSVISVLYDMYSDTLYGIIFRIVEQEELAEDVLQESFIKIWKNGGKYDATKGTLFTWMLNICRNTAIDKTRTAHFRKKQMVHTIDDKVKNQNSLSVQQNTDLIGLDEAVDKLDEKYKTIIDLIYFKGFTQKEVTEQLDIPLGTVKSRVRIALRELRKRFTSDKTPLLIVLSLLLI